MIKKDIIDAYVRIRTIDHTIPDDVLGFMKEAALERLENSNKLDVAYEALKNLCYCLTGDQQSEDELEKGLGTPVYNGLIRAQAVIELLKGNQQ